MFLDGLPTYCCCCCFLGWPSSRHQHPVHTTHVPYIRIKVDGLYSTNILFTRKTISGHPNNNHHLRRLLLWLPISFSSVPGLVVDWRLDDGWSGLFRSGGENVSWIYLLSSFPPIQISSGIRSGSGWDGGEGEEDIYPSPDKQDTAEQRERFVETHHQQHSLVAVRLIIHREGKAKHIIGRCRRLCLRVSCGPDKT